MKIKIKPLALFAALALLLALFAGCSSQTIEIHNPESAAQLIVAEDIITIAQEMVPLTESPAVFSIPMPSAPGTDVLKNAKAEIDVSNKKDGYIMIKYLEKTSKVLKVQIKGPSAATYTYTLKPGGDYEVFPLSDGSGTYQIGVYVNIEGSKYSTAHSGSIDVKLSDEFAPFLRPNQYVNYKADSEVVKKAAEITKDAKTVLEKITIVYEYVVSNITYDKELAKNVKSGYLPDVDSVLKRGKGICFDYAAVMAAMLRSQNVPAKLVIGYVSGDVYHAWISTYAEDIGWVDSIIYFDGKSWKLMDPTFASSGNKSEEVMKFIGDGKNYTVKYLY